MHLSLFLGVSWTDLEGFTDDIPYLHIAIIIDSVDVDFYWHNFKP